MPLDFTKDVLFVGHGCTAPCWYRVVLPAMTLGADYVGVVGEPPDTHYVTGIVQGRSAMPMFSDYRVVILPEARDRGRLRMRRLAARDQEPGRPRLPRGLRQRGAVGVRDVHEGV
jgi:hypothetical protein